jgi:hypothetical protein
MLDRLFAFLALAGLVAFCAVLVVYVKRWDLGVVIIICLLLAAYDLLIFSFRNKNGRAESKAPNE